MYGTYRKIETFADVPPAGPLSAQVRESHRLDFKEFATSVDTAEYAKDMATFANGFGGVILVGSKVTDGIVAHTGIPLADAARRADVYEQSAKDKCSPAPVVNAMPIEMPGGGTSFLLAVNVDPFIEGPVGAGGKERDGWIFPMREGSHMKYLKPNELPMYMNPKLRRTLLLLDRIPDHANAKVTLLHQPGYAMSHANVVGSPPLQREDATKKAVHLDRNSAEFSLMGRAAISIPLTEIEDIWMDAAGDWNIRVSGRIEKPAMDKPTQYIAVAR